MSRLRTDWKRAPERGRGHRLSPEGADAIWEAFLGYLATMSATEASKRPGMPSRVAFAKKRARDPEYDARARTMIAGRKLETSGRKRLRPDVWAAFLKQLPFTSVNKLTAVPGMPSLAAVYKRRAKDEAFRRKLDAVLHDVRREREVRIARALRLVAQRRDLDFIGRMEDALALYRQRLRAPKPQSRPPMGEVHQGTLLRNDLYAAAAAVVPAHLSPAHRADIISDLVLGVLEGQIEIANLRAAVKEVSKRHWKMFGTFNTVSIDAPAFAGSRETIGDRLASEAA